MLLINKTKSISDELRLKLGQKLILEHSLLHNFLFRYNPKLFEKFFHCLLIEEFLSMQDMGLSYQNLMMVHLVLQIYIIDL